jgi:hypothetical protein
MESEGGSSDDFFSLISSPTKISSPSSFSSFSSSSINFFILSSFSFSSNGCGAAIHAIHQFK